MVRPDTWQDASLSKALFLNCAFYPSRIPFVKDLNVFETSKWEVVSFWRPLSYELNFPPMYA